MPARDFLLNNLQWKVTAFVLALLVWFAIKLAIYKEATGGREQMIRHQQVMALKSPDDPRLFRVEPAYVDVAVQGTKQFELDDLQVFVDLRSWPEGVNSAFKMVLVRAVDASRIRVDPLFVMVERTAPPEGPIGTLKKP